MLGATMRRWRTSRGARGPAFGSDQQEVVLPPLGPTSQESGPEPPRRSSLPSPLPMRWSSNGVPNPPSISWRCGDRPSAFGTPGRWCGATPASHRSTRFALDRVDAPASVTKTSAWPRRARCLVTSGSTLASRRYAAGRTAGNRAAGPRDSPDPKAPANAVVARAATSRSRLIPRPRPTERERVTSSCSKGQMMEVVHRKHPPKGEADGSDLTSRPLPRVRPRSSGPPR